MKDRCPFQFSVFCCRFDSNLYLSLKPDTQNIRDASIHRGHLKNCCDYVFSHLSTLNQDAMEMIMTLHAENTSYSRIAASITKMFGQNKFTYTRKQIAHIIMKRSTELVCENYKDLSSAEQLLYHFDKLQWDENTSFHYVAMVHSIEEGFKIKLPHGRPSKVIDGVDDTSIIRIRNSMRVNDNQEVLLAIAWCSEYERKN